MLMYILFTVVVALCLFEILINHSEKARLIKKIPGPRDVFLVGNGLEFMVTPVELFKLGRKYAKKCNGIYRFWAFPRAAVNLYNPEDIEVVISTVKHNSKSTLYNFLKPWLWGGLLLSDGSKWHQRRKILTPAFHFNILRQFFLVLEDNSNRLIKILEATSGKAVDIVPILSEYTLNSICETAMGTQLSNQEISAAKSYKEAIYELGALLFKRVTRIYYHSSFVFNLSSLGRRQVECLKTIRDFTKRVIKDRTEYIQANGISTNEDIIDESFMTSKRKTTAMLDLLLLAEKDGRIDRRGIQEEVDTFMFEGHDTTASGLTFCLLLLANNKEIQDKVYKELKDILGESVRPANFEDLSKMRYLECCIKESMRLYPPVPIISRALSESVTLSNYKIPEGSYCNIHIYDLHRREDLFKNPENFDPDRFLPENCVSRHPYAYIPFSAGPRNCIGQKFAMMEMKSALSAILRRFELVPITHPADLEVAADLVLRNSKPVYVSFKTRDE